MAAQPSRKRRIFKWAALAFAVPLLLLASYIASWGAHESLRSDKPEWLDSLRLDDNLFAPLTMYAESDMPLADDLRAFYMWCFSRGDISWEMAKAVS
jgi:hypothetical protein